MPSWKNEHYKGIAHYAKAHELRIAMGSWPNAKFIDRDGKERSVNINEIMQSYETNKKDEARERRRLKQEEENRKPWHERFKQN